MENFGYFPKQKKTCRLSWASYVKLNYIPIGSMYAIYGNIYHQYTPNVSIYHTWILWDCSNCVKIVFIVPLCTIEKSSSLFQLAGSGVKRLTKIIWVGKIAVISIKMYQTKGKAMIHSTWVISHVPMFHITQPLGINGLLDGYYFG